MPEVTFANVVSLCVQAACVVTIAGAATALLRITSPTLHYWIWRVAVLVCVALPFVQRSDTPVPTSVNVDIIEVAPVAAAPAAPTPARGLELTDWLGRVILLGGVARFGWLAVGLARLRRLRGRGVPADPADHEGLQSVLGTRADVRYVGGLAQPSTFGVWRPVVLLPETLRDRTTVRHAALAHELVHVQRRDWAWVLVEEVLRSALWFHPALWWAITRLQLAREEVVDEHAAALTGDRRAYVRALLSFADDAPLAHAPAFARRRHLFRRIVLLTMEDVMSARRILVSACAVLSAVSFGAWSAIAAFPTHTMQVDVLQLAPGPLERVARPTGPDNPIPRPVHVEPALFPQNAPDDARVSVTLRTVVDETGAVREIRFYGFTMSLSGFNATMSGGASALAGFEAFAGNASRRSDTPPVPVAAMRATLEAFIDAAASSVLRSQYEPPDQAPIVFSTIVQFHGSQPVAVIRTAPVMNDLTADGALRVGGAMKTPTKVRDAKPVYPPEAREAGVQGVVIVEARIEPDGHVSAAQILRSIPMLDQAALDAVYQWEFTPTLINGVPTAVVMTVTIQFSLN